MSTSLSYRQGRRSNVRAREQYLGRGHITNNDFKSKLIAKRQGLEYHVFLFFLLRETSEVIMSRSYKQTSVKATFSLCPYTTPPSPPYSSVSGYRISVIRNNIFHNKNDVIEEEGNDFSSSEYTEIPISDSSNYTYIEKRGKNFNFYRIFSS